MLFKFQIGDRLIVDSPGSGAHGHEVTIRGRVRSGDSYGRMLSRYNVEFDSGNVLTIPEGELRSKPVSFKLPTGGIYTHHYTVHRGKALASETPHSTSNACKCDSLDLMRYGCKCGAFKREVSNADAS